MAEDISRPSCIEVLRRTGPAPVATRLLCQVRLSVGHEKTQGSRPENNPPVLVWAPESYLDLLN